MLARQQCCRGNDRNLKTRHGRCKGRAHRDFCLTETNIAAHQAIHWLASRQVLKHFFNYTELIFCFLIGEAVNEACISRAVNLDN